MTTTAAASNNGAGAEGLQAEIEEFTQRRRGDLEEVEREIEAVHQQLDRLHERKKWIQKILRSLDPDQPGPGRKPKQPSKLKHIGAEKFLKVIEAVEQIPDGEKLSVLGLHEALGGDEVMSRETIRTGIERLRERAVVGFVRKEPGRGGRVVYRLLNREAAVQLKAELAERIQAERS